MPKGTFLILLPNDADYKVLGYFFSDKRTEFSVTSDIFLRLNLDHSKNEYNLLKLKDLIIFSYLHQLKGKLTRKASGFIIGLLLYEDDEVDKLKEPLKKVAEALALKNIIEMSESTFEDDLQREYTEQIQEIKDMIDMESIRNSIINHTKELLSGGKKERKIADELLKKIEMGIPDKIGQFYQTAEEALKVSEYEKASKFFEKTAEVAEELRETELATELRIKAKNSISIPDNTKKLKEAVQKAREALKNEDFNFAYLCYKTAADLSKSLMITEKEEEYSLKAKALQDFHQVDQKYKKK